jgi:hypothetical protein
VTDSYRKREWAGEPIKDQRRVVPEPPRVPPHKKPREYKLSMRIKTVAIRVCEKSFPSKAARDQFRQLVERDLKNKTQIAIWQFTGETVAHDKTVDFEESLNGVVTSPVRRSGDV